MKNQFKKLVAFLGICTIVLIACQKNITDTPAAGQNKLNIFLTDGPSVVFDSIFIDIQKLEVKIETKRDSEYWAVAPINPGIYNILRFRNGVDTLFSQAVIPQGEIKKIRLTLGTRNSVSKNGLSFPLSLHENKNTVTIDIPDVDQIDPSKFQIWLDFDGHGSIIQVRNGVFVLKPNIHTFNNNRSGRVEGRIKPGDALPAIVAAINGTDTAFAITEKDGKFKIRGLRASTTKLLIIPSNGYKDSLMNNITLLMGNDAKLGDIVLHK
jgi:hypothetical protein